MSPNYIASAPREWSLNRRDCSIMSSLWGLQNRSFIAFELLLKFNFVIRYHNHNGFSMVCFHVCLNNIIQSAAYTRRVQALVVRIVIMIMAYWRGRIKYYQTILGLTSKWFVLYAFSNKGTNIATLFRLNTTDPLLTSCLSILPFLLLSIYNLLDSCPAKGTY